MSTKCPQTDNWCTSELETIKTSFKWVINDFSRWTYEPGQCIQSSTFGADEDIKTKWHLKVFPCGLDVHSREYVSIYLLLEKCDQNKVLAEADVRIVDSNQQIKNQWPTTRNCTLLPNDVPIHQLYFNKKSELIRQGLLPNDVLTIYCHIDYVSKRKTIGGQNIGLKRSHQKLLEDMTSLYQKPNDSDVEIVVKGYKFSAHKVILKARSPVFGAMFTHQMEENQQNNVVINDIEKEVFSKVLRYIYTDSVVNDDINSGLKLLSAADKYNLNDLKSICEEYIGSQLTVESVCYVLILADNHSAQELKAKAIDFIKKNSNQVMKTKGWTEIVINRSDLLQLF